MYQKKFLKGWQLKMINNEYIGQMTTTFGPTHFRSFMKQREHGNMKFANTFLLKSCGVPLTTWLISSFSSGILLGSLDYTVSTKYCLVYFLTKCTTLFSLYIRSVLISLQRIISLQFL